MKEMDRAERNKQIAAYYLAGHTAAETGKEFGLVRTAILYILQQQGVERRKSSGTRGKTGRARPKRFIARVLKDLDENDFL